MIEYVRKGGFVSKNGEIKFKGSRAKRGVLIAISYKDMVVLG